VHEVAFIYGGDQRRGSYREGFLAKKGTGGEVGLGLEN